MILGFGLCLTALHILEHTDNGANPIDNIIRLKVEGILMTSSMFWLSIVFITCLVLGDPKYRQLNITIVGSFGNICSLVFYLAPLTNIREIIRKKDSSSLYAPAIVINLLSSILWFFYGLYGISQEIVWIPSAVGVVVCIFELYICWHYPLLPKQEFDEVADDHYRHNDFAVFASSRHMSISADFGELLGFPSSSVKVDENNNDDNSNSEKYTKTCKSPMFTTLEGIPEENVPRNRSVTTSAINENKIKSSFSETNHVTGLTVNSAKV